mmetsp:Transcript_65147/g.174687  ORF Transcript_65147/g.174687 Transcript_65147/m.174687 type:complete len:250 (-) Transcript_65147:409-1158(-)
MSSLRRTTRPNEDARYGTTRWPCFSLVDFHMPLLLGLESLEPFVVVDFLFFADGLEHVLDSGHHTLEAAEVNVGSTVQLGKDFVGVLLHLILNVHLATVFVFLFAGKRVVEAEVFGVFLEDRLPLVVVEKSVAVGDAEEEPGLALVSFSCWSFFRKKTTDEATVGGNTSTGGYHDVVRVRFFFGQKHDFPGGSGHVDFVTGFGVAQKVGADSLLGRIVGLEVGAPVGRPTHAKGTRLAGHVVSVAGGGD